MHELPFSLGLIPDAALEFAAIRSVLDVAAELWAAVSAIVFLIIIPLVRRPSDVAITPDATPVNGETRIVSLPTTA